MKEETLNKIINVIRMHLNEEVPTNNASSSTIAGLPPDHPPVDLRKKKERKWNPFFKNLARIQRRSDKNF